MAGSLTHRARRERNDWAAPKRRQDDHVQRRRPGRQPTSGLVMRAAYTPGETSVVSAHELKWEATMCERSRGSSVGAGVGLKTSARAHIGGS